MVAPAPTPSKSSAALPARVVPPTSLPLSETKSPASEVPAATAVGGLKLRDAQTQLLQMLNDPDQVVQVSVRYGLHCLGNTAHSHDLEKSARSTEWSVRAQTALVLGLLQDPSGLKILRVLKRDPNAAVRQQALEAMWRMADEDAMKELVGYTASRYVDDQMFALQALVAPRDHRMKDLLEGFLTTEYPEVNLTAARALGQLDSDRGYAVAVEGTNSSDPLHRFLAARAFATIGRSDSQDVLRKLMTDSAPRSALRPRGRSCSLRKAPERAQQCAVVPRVVGRRVGSPGFTRTSYISSV